MNARPQPSTPVGLTPKQQRRLRRLDGMARQLDESIRIPGIGYRIGYDALIGLIPGAGDIIGMLLSMYIVVEAARFRISKVTLVRMVTNVAIETLIGTIPLVGDTFDAVYKANLRNLRLLHERLGERDVRSIGDRLFFTSILLIPLILVAAVAALLIYLIGLL